MKIPKALDRTRPFTYNCVIAAVLLTIKSKSMSMLSSPLVSIDEKTLYVSCDRIPEFGVMEKRKYL